MASDESLEAEVRAEAAAAVVSLSALKRLASRTYSGWRGWHHSWHWPNMAEVTRLTHLRLWRKEAVTELDSMEIALSQLKDRVRAARLLVDLLDREIQDSVDMEANDGE